MDKPLTGRSTDDYRHPSPKGSGRVLAVLGPTNTGKTFLAVERMLAHQKGMIGFPLRLLARENYDKIVKIKGAAQVALVTGEEKIIPPNPRYYVCTVESMPLDVMVDFLAIDEIQMAADPERGHIFTDRLLYARGLDETMLLGAETARHLIRKLVPHCEFVTRPRFSTLSYAGHKKVTRLPPRSAVVAFSAAEVYRIAELVRRQRGGTAVVLGALSPRTRNAQVAMYQAGEVDYLVATDAIGMGLNMDVRHVAFSALHKYDGHKVRDLLPGEVGQIAGRAGRHMSDGTFGTTAGQDGMGPELVQRVEEHDFDMLRTLMWRNGDLDFRTVNGLLRTLEEKPPYPFLRRARRADDHRTLEALAKMPSVAERAVGYDAVRLLWDICQVPDFSKTLTDSHTRLLARIFEFRAKGEGKLAPDWVANHINRLNRTDGDIDTLMSRIAGTRTWTYIAHRTGWLDDPEHWRKQALAIEDNLSDALHDRLTQRFVDRRTAVLVRRLRDGDELIGGVTPEGQVVVEGETVGTLNGFRFSPEAADRGEDGRALLNAANRVLRQEIDSRVAQLANAEHGEFALSEGNRIMWNGEPAGVLAKGADWLKPCVEPLSSALLDSRHRQAMRARLQTWLEEEVRRRVGPLAEVREIDGTPALRGIGYRLAEDAGVLERRKVRAEVDNLSKAERKRLAASGVRIGQENLFLPQLMRGAPNRWRLMLWQLYHGNGETPRERAPVLSVGEEADPVWYRICGYVLVGVHAIRLDRWESFAAAVFKAANDGRLAANDELAKTASLPAEALPPLLKRLRFYPTGAANDDGEAVFAKRGTKGAKKPRNPRRVNGGGSGATPSSSTAPSVTGSSAGSPFAGLREALAIAGSS
ncbi:MAG TPA: helicase-related protein [Alphaproteobacteria bacterium]|nr:helicase-related protein [Alphaproteobacteria bacterium]